MSDRKKIVDRRMVGRGPLVGTGLLTVNVVVPPDVRRIVPGLSKPCLRCGTGPHPCKHQRPPEHV